MSHWPSSDYLSNYLKAEAKKVRILWISIDKDYAYQRIKFVRFYCISLSFKEGSNYRSVAFMRDFLRVNKYRFTPSCHIDSDKLGVNCEWNNEMPDDSMWSRSAFDHYNVNMILDGRLEWRRKCCQNSILSGLIKRCNFISRFCVRCWILALKRTHVVGSIYT